tara:strand:- start:701 stop:1786 length:1086 start_codon:yes stop_codon:yes gene_type:complete
MNEKSELVELTPYFDDFVNYYKKAEILQNQCVLGNASPVGLVNDDLMEQVHIYDVVNRQYADINNMVQDTWNGSNTPKIGQAIRKNGEDYRLVLERFDQVRSIWTRKEYLYAFLVHRITGSAASYVEDHGYRNTVLKNLAECDSIHGMVEVIRNFDRPMYTSKGCQIPGFPKLARTDLIKSGHSYSKPGIMYLCECAPQIIDELDRRLTYAEEKNLKIPIRRVVDWMNTWNSSRKFNRFAFQYSLFVADISDYWGVIDEDSRVYYGTAARYSLDLMGKKKGRIGTLDRHDYLCELIQEATGAKPKWVEHTLCDYKKFIYNRIPEGKLYEHIDRTKVFGDSLIKNHPEGRQQWMLNTPHWKW